MAEERSGLNSPVTSEPSEHQELLDAIVEGTNDLIFLKDAKGRFVLVNKRFAEAMGRQPQDVIGQTDFELVSHEWANQFVAVDREVMDTCAQRVFEHTVSYGGAARTYLTNKMPWRNDEGEVVGVIGISHDMTERHRLLARLQRAREEERRRLARNVHDDLGSTLTRLRMDLWACAESMPDDPASFNDSAQALSDLVDAALRQVQDISWRLRSPLLDDFGLIAAIQAEVIDFAARSCPCIFECAVDEFPRDFELETTVFRILRESLTNVSRHADASRVHVSLRLEDGVVELDVEDDGKGIDAEAIHDASSLGLMGMRERAAALGGDVRFDRSQSGGTVIRLRIPPRATAAK